MRAVANSYLVEQQDVACVRAGGRACGRACVRACVRAARGARAACLGKPFLDPKTTFPCCFGLPKNNLSIFFPNLQDLAANFVLKHFRPLGTFPIKLGRTVTLGTKLAPLFWAGVTKLQDLAANLLNFRPLGTFPIKLGHHWGALPPLKKAPWALFPPK